MKVLILPSWFPHKESPYSGIFCLEQAMALANEYPKDEFYILNYGQDQFYLDLKKPIASIKKVRDFFAVSVGTQPLKKNLFQINIPIFSWTDKLGGFQFLAKNLLKGLEELELDVDICHAHVAFPAGALAAVIKNKLGVPFILTEHMSPFPFPHLLKGGKVKQKLMDAYEASELNIAVSSSMKTNMDRFNIPSLKVIPNVVDENYFIDQGRKRVKKRIFTLGGLVSQKNFSCLLEAVSLLKVDVELRIGGEGPLFSILKAKIKELSLEKKVKLLGPLSREECLNEFNEASFFVLPSLHETFGVVLVESMMCGTPVVATKSGGPEDFVIDSVGIICEPDDVNSLAVAIANMIENRDDFDSTKIRDYAISKFSKRAVSKMIYQEYQKCVD